MSISITTKELREAYQAFFENKGHARISSAPLVPENDPSVLFTTAGMHPLVPYLKGEPHPSGTRLTNMQVCLRTSDIEEVGDATHGTVFEMLGNWSLGDYFKKETIMWSWEFLTKELGIDSNYLAVSVFAGDSDSSRDEESADIWKEVGVLVNRIAYLDKEENWWPSGGKQQGPQGPDTEMFYWSSTETPPEKFNPDDDRWVEIWNDVFMQYERGADGGYSDLIQKNVDTGMGLERMIMVLNGYSSIYEIDTYEEVMNLIVSSAQNRNERHERIIADHMKAATFLLGDEHPVVPSNTDQGYVLRRLLRRAIRSARILGVNEPMFFMKRMLELFIAEYGDAYPSLQTHISSAASVLQDEVTKFNSVIQKGLKKFDEVCKEAQGSITGAQAFRLYESYGFPIELTEELAQEHGLSVDMDGFSDALSAHQERSRKGAKEKFSGGLADHSEQTVAYHTATHLLHQALRDVLGSHVQQKGSNITPERLRFDFSHPEKMTDEEKKRVEVLVNEKIKADLPITREEMGVQEAKDKGAQGLFESKYGNAVSVYSIGDFSCEICGGPHVEQTGGLGVFKIIKEESAGSGVRRIRAILE